MIYLKFTLMMFFNWFLILVAIFINPMLPFFAIQRIGELNNGSEIGQGYYLPDWLEWFGTLDNDLTGDYGWKYEHFQWRHHLPITLANYLGQVGWLYRNPAYAYGIRFLNAPFITTVKGDPNIRDNNQAKEGWCFVTANGLFLFRWIKRIGNTNRCIYINLGWNIMGLVDDGVNPKLNPWQATFIASPRISGFRT